MRLAALKLDSLNDLFAQELKDLYNAEQQMIDALPKMIDAASSRELKNAFEKHLDETKQQAERLEQVFEMLDMEPEEEKCEGMAGILRDGDTMVNSKGDSDVKDAALIGAVQKAKHYEIAVYGTLRTYARVLGHDDAAEMLQQTLNQERDTDQQLTHLAERSINISAASM